jgi:hypothetical protein
MTFRGRFVARLSEDRGSAVAEFAMISVLLVFLLFGVLQVGALFFVRSIVGSAAAAGARYGATAGASSGEAGPHASDEIAKALGAGMTKHLECDGTEALDGASGLTTSRVHCHGRIRSIFLPTGAFTEIDVTASSLKERQ